MRLISWNVMGGYGGHMSDQVAALGERLPDVVALQEITARVAPVYREHFQRHGLYSIIDSFQFARYMTRLHSNSYGEMIASKWPLITLPIHFEVPWPEKLLSCFVIGPWGDVQLHTAHVPKGRNNDVRKIQTLEGIYKGLAVKSQYPRILCGDLGTPQEETADGAVVTWGQKRKRGGEIVLQQYWGLKWDTWERNVLEGLARYDLADTFRQVNGKKRDVSCFEVENGRRSGRRYDHIFASASLNPVECRYLHYLRERRLSEHSPVEAVFSPIIAQTNPSALASFPAGRRDE
ncbi:MAG TPA: endonuclease/exonuclease/phosphatase family protein [Methanocella sp.]|nr:endonuclease/exonuclease/phosphatase family protein [Methanocella sp.]